MYYLKAKGEDDDLPGVIGVTDGVPRAEAETLLPFPQTFIVLVCLKLSVLAPISVASSKRTN